MTDAVPFAGFACKLCHAVLVEPLDAQIIALPPAERWSSAATRILNHSASHKNHGRRRFGR